MTSTTISPRMAAIYASGTVHARRWHVEGDVRGCRPPSGWTARADLTDIPVRGGRKNPGAAVAAPGGQDQQPNQNATAFALAQAAALKASL